MISMPANSAQIFRKYASASSVKLAVSVGSTVSLTISIGALKELLALSAKGINKIPTPGKVALWCVSSRSHSPTLARQVS